jgi:hypothetical protein
MRHAFQEEGSQWKLKEELDSLLQDQQLSKIEHHQVIQTPQDKMEQQRVDFKSQHNDSVQPATLGRRASKQKVTRRRHRNKKLYAIITL